MAGRKRAAPASARSTRSTRTTRASSSREAVPEVYRQMLTDAEVRPNATVESPERPAKRRKPGERSKPAHPPKPSAPVPPSSKIAESDDEDEEEEGIEFEDVGLPVPTVQTIMRDTDEEQDDDDDEDDELEFENVNLDFSIAESNASQVNSEPKEIQLDLTARADAMPRRAVDRRKPINKVEKDRRVEIHKTHLLCLLSHVARRNRWCNDAQVQRSMKKLLTNKMITYLNPGSNLSQFGQTNSLKEGLKQLEAKFKTEYTITERGMRRALWADSEEHLKNYQLPEDAETVTERSDFREIAESLKGSRDVGAQLYCALLRSAGVEVRLVCSLQPLSFAPGGPSMSKPPKSKKYLSAEERLARQPKYDSSFETPGINKNAPSALRRLGHPSAASWQFPSMAAASTPRPVQETPKKIRECPFPIYWVEVLDVFEPPANERDNCMTYVVGFEADGSAVDVTRRYAKAYNAKTRKMRIEGIAANGERWWRKALRAYSRGYTTDVDQIESNELAAAEAREPMPRNVADFKDHPIYALERHLRRNEVLVPGAQAAGTVGAGSKGPLERIYRRKDVRIARTREKWYRMGREVPGDEVPVKVLPKRAKKQMDVFGDEEDDEGEGGEVGTPIFTMEQTKLYEPPPVVNGVIPKNRFKNLDVYVPSMVPKGGAYVADDLATHAAYTLGIDYAPALTGFQFRGRKGTAVLHGAVVAAEHEEAVRAVIEGLRDVEADMERERRTREVLKMWKRFLMNLRVRQRIWAGVEEGAEDKMDQDEVEKIAEEEARKAEEHAEGSEAEGGFIVDDDDDYGGGGFL
ncbi:DNA repair protein Rad4 [Apiospora marii]|uniref:DNA repair protein Rad4 n=1 Tax=Apiospora marii TaxID=335849 RepID=UPI0031325464